MKVFILRHGQAETYAPSDQQRALTARGESEVRRVCDHAVQALAEVQQIFYSPYLRAVQTSEIAGEYISAPREQCEILTPAGRVNDVIEFLYGASEAFDSVLLVSHQPLVGELVHALTGVEAARHSMGTASLAYIACDPVARDCCELNWLNQP